MATIQVASPEAARWKVTDYLDHQCLVASVAGSVVGFLAFRTVAPDEREVLNLAVSPDFRRRGAGRRLFAASLEGFQGLVFLEVRESNTAARLFYKSMSFMEVMRRQNYYQDPLEAAIVMKFHSC